MNFRAILLRGLTREEQKKVLLLSAWFFVSVATLWLLKPVRAAGLLAHLGANETPYVRLAGVVTVGVVVLFYSAAINRLSRLSVVVWASGAFATLLMLFWTAIRIWGPALGAHRPFVWAVYILVEIYAVVMIGIFWTYTNDVVTSDEANRIYGVVGLGGILGGAAGGAFVDAFARALGTINLLTFCAGLVMVGAGIAWLTEKVIRPPPRRRDLAPKRRGFATAMDGAREVGKSQYLMLLVAIVVAYEFTATLTDFGVSVIFERSFHDEAQLAQMYGRLGWISSGTAVVAQVFLVPLLLPSKRLALLLPPVAMLAGAVGVVILPVIATAIFLSAADRGLNYSIQQATKESLYVPLSDAQKYKAKAFIDMFVDRAAKALAAFVLIAVIRFADGSERLAFYVSFASLAVWLGSARRLGKFWNGDLHGAGSAKAPNASDELPAGTQPGIADGAPSAVRSP